MFLGFGLFIIPVLAQEVEDAPDNGKLPPSAEKQKGKKKKEASSSPLKIEIWKLAHAKPDPAISEKCIALLKRPATFEEADHQARELLKLLTPEERYAMTEGSIRQGLGRIGLPALSTRDSSYGINIGHGTDGVKSTSQPCPVLLAATWNPQLAFEEARAVAEEFRTFGIHFILGPGLNIYRVSRCGRNFEYLGEDPYLVSRMVEAYVKGAQDVGVAVTLKHFLANNNEYRRRGTEVLADERTLREIYMPGFKAGIDAGAWSVMTSYNLLNGEWCGESSYVIKELIRKDLGFRNVVMSDFGSLNNGEAAIRAGQNLEMPSGDNIYRVKDRYLGSPEIDENVVEILRTGILSGLYELEAAGKFIQPGWISKYPQHVEVARKIADEGITMLKNDGVLPVKAVPQGAILVTGNWANIPVLAGFGSSRAVGYDNQTYLDALKKQFGPDKVIHSENPSDEEIKKASLVLVFSGHPQKGETGDQETDPFQFEGEGRDHSFILKSNAQIQHCANLNPRTIVCLTTGSGVEMDWADKTAAILQCYFPGQAGAQALMDILTGKINPSGKLPFTIEKKFEESPAFGYDKDNPGSKSYTKDAVPNTGCQKVLLQNSKGLYFTHQIPYKEGVFVGYRWYDEKNITPRFPFGHGLSYTTFGYDNLSLEKQGDTVQVRFRVKNTGQRDGAEVAQVYVHDQKASVPRPPKELKGFNKVFLKPGESQDIQLTLKPDAFQFWDEATKQWKLEPGKFDILVGASSRDIRLKEGIELP